ncbi:MAG: hypothetical protein PHS44_03985 [Candidatus Dojkabacteria bacterium]|jgi:uncharacterized protein YhbP (UPF0306 family)|nr:hypothetical protein [Candidatus Dojkabacteria bacterium]
MTNLKIAKKIIKDNIYLTLSTSDNTTNWSAPIFFAKTKDFDTFYFVSDKKAIHSKHISINPYVSGSIFNSQEIPEKVNGVQFDGLAYEVGLKELPKAIKCIYSTKEADLLKERFKDYLNPKSYKIFTNFRIYKIKTLHFYILDPHVTLEDRRVEVRM